MPTAKALMAARQPDRAPWTSEWERRRHFRKHGPSLGLSTAEAYDASARATIRAGRRFTFRRARTGDPRVGYYHLATRRLTVLDGPESRVITHFRCRERYVRRLDGSTYTRS
jgi:hypothetical protein